MARERSLFPNILHGAQHCFSRQIFLTGFLSPERMTRCCTLMLWNEGPLALLHSLPAPGSMCAPRMAANDGRGAKNLAVLYIWSAILWQMLPTFCLTNDARPLCQSWYTDICIWCVSEPNFNKTPTPKYNLICILIFLSVQINSAYIFKLNGAECAWNVE